MARKRVSDLDASSTVEFEKVGQTVQGYYIGAKIVTTDYGKSKLHILQTEAGNVGVWGSAKLDEKLGAVEPGYLTFITYRGKVKLPGGKTMKKFDVEYDDEEKAEISTAALRATAADDEEAIEEEEETVESAEEIDEEAQDIDEETMEAADEDEEEAPPAKAAKRPLTKGRPASVSREQANAVTNLLSKSKR